jgi:hypothetical protein
MALFTDGPISVIEDMTAQDSQLLNVASNEGIDVTRKLALAQDEIAMEIMALLTNSNFGSQSAGNSPQLDIGSIVVTPPLKLWHTLRSLELVYSDAYNSQLNDRYAGKRDQFQKMAAWAYDKLNQIGIGLTSFPVPQAATPELVAAAPVSQDFPLPDGMYSVTMAWTNGGEEGASAIPATITTSASTIEVHPGAVPAGATGWNVYVGLTPSATLQNTVPIPVGQVWLQPGVLGTTGRAPGSGQSPSYIKPVPRMIQRG